MDLLKKKSICWTSHHPLEFDSSEHTLAEQANAKGALESYHLRQVKEAPERGSHCFKAGEK